MLIAILTGGSGLCLFKNPAGFDLARKVRYGLAPGSGDYVGLFRGRYVEIEFKTAVGRQSADQLMHQQLIERLGGFYAIVRCEDDARAVLRQLGGLPQTTTGQQ